MARTAPGEARAKTRKARKATGNPRKAKESADLATPTPGAAARSESEADGVGPGSTVGRRQPIQPGTADARTRAAQALAAMRASSRGQMTEEEARAGEIDPEALPEGALDELPEEDLGEEGADEEAADSEELGTRPNPSIKTEGQIKRAAKAVKKVEQQRRRKIIRRIIIAVVLLILAGLVALCVLFAQHRWYTYDDVEDFIGTWYVEDTDLPIVITEDKIELTDGVAYTYRIDPETKTITFKFGNMTGEGRYRFSLDRQQLSIMDGEYGYWDTLLDDAAWTLQAVMRDVRGLSMLNPSLEANMISKGTLTLLRQPNAEATALPEGADANDDSSLLDDVDDSGESEPENAADGTADTASGSNGDAPTGMGFTQLDVNDL